jgi:predicted Zn-dependent protease
MTSQSACVAAERLISKRPPDRDVVDQIKREYAIAADADPWLREPRRQLAETGLGQWAVTDAAGRHNRNFLYDFQHWIEEEERVDPLSTEVWQAAAAGWVEIYRASGQAARGDAAVAAARRAVELYPNSPVLQFDLAETLHTTHHPGPAKAAAQEALRLDGLTPHDDKKLSTEQRAEAQRIAKDAAGPQPAEQ